MIRFGFAFVALALVSACSTTPASIAAKVEALEVQALDTGAEACEVRGRIVPFVQAGASFAAVFVPELAPWVALDKSTVSPVLDAACAGIGGLVVAPAK